MILLNRSRENSCTESQNRAPPETWKDEHALVGTAPRELYNKNEHLSVSWSK